MKRPPAPRVVIFAGPNGAGKTTHAELMLEALGIQTFVNADFILQRSTPTSPSNRRFPAAASRPSCAN
jgi:predicted ABC-type ATPase